MSDVVVVVSDVLVVVSEVLVVVATKIIFVRYDKRTKVGRRRPLLFGYLAV